MLDFDFKTVPEVQLGRCSLFERPEGPDTQMDLNSRVYGGRAVRRVVKPAQMTPESVEATGQKARKGSYTAHFRTG